MFDNLLSNAVKYAPAGDITITLSRHQDRAEASIQDRGPGILPEHLPYIFDRFYRENGRQSPHRGVGLGLSITRALVEAHGGAIRADSEPGNGSVFTVTLPWETPQAKAQRQGG